MATVYREAWTGEVIKGFSVGLKDTFLDGVKDYSQYVEGGEESQIIHSTYFAVHPDVLINNTTYPIGMQKLDGKDVTIILDKYQTKSTPVTDDELYALAYKKMELVKEAHVEALVSNRLKMAIHAFAPNTHEVNHPVLVTTGEKVGNRKRMRWVDIINIRAAYAKMGVPIENLRIVLCPDHVNDLLVEETSMLAKSYANFQGGVITNQLGLEFREFANTPYYNVAAKTKVSFGAIVDDATDMQASVVFPIKKVGKATGMTKMYWSKAENDPDNQQNKINFRNYFVATPMIETGFVAVVSDIV